MINLLSSDTFALEYLKESLNESNSLALRASDKISFSEGRLSIIAGSDTKKLSFSNFRFGGVASLAASTKELAQILEYLLSESETLLILEDPIVRATDHRRIDPPAMLKTVREEVYVLLKSDKYQSDCIEKVLGVPHYYHSEVGFLCHAAAGVIQEEWTDTKMSALVENIFVVFVGAFDGESFLLWQK